jgi:methionyl-tRNA formyltransferase
VLQPAKIKTEEFRNGLLSYQPDLIVVTAYGRILPKSLLDLAPMGCINVHGSLLPRHRGAAPIQWSILQGDRKVGVTIIKMDEGMDTGDILLKTDLEPSPDETAGTLFEKLAELGGKTLLKAVEGLKDGTIAPTPQEHDKATEAPLLKKSDGLIDWSREGGEIERFIRGLDPWPCSFTYLDGRRIKLFRPEVIYRESDTPPGSLLEINKNGLLISCGKDSLLIKEIQPEGKKRMSVAAFLCGSPLKAGTILTGREASKQL